MQVCKPKLIRQTLTALFCDNFEWVIVFDLKDINNGSKCNENLLGYEVRWSKHGSIIWWSLWRGYLCSKARIWTIYIYNSFSLLVDFHHLFTISLHFFSSLPLQLCIIMVWFGSVLYTFFKNFIILSLFSKQEVNEFFSGQRHMR